MASLCCVLAVEFLWDNVIESLQQLKNDDDDDDNADNATASRGCILAHCMGLGKTLSVCRLTATIANNHNYNTHLTTLWDYPGEPVPET